MSQIFISHSSKDKQKAREISLALKVKGHEVWIDEEQIYVGENIIKKVQEALINSEFVLLVISKHSLESGWVQEEWMMTWWGEIQKRNIKLLPILLEKCTLPSFLTYRKYAAFFQIGNQFQVKKNNLKLV